jgi:hypothetical protein
VLHTLMKKSNAGIDLQKPDTDVIEARLKRARLLDLED